jgi:nitric oxide reductase subunit B
MKSTRRLWRWLGLIFVLSFGALGFLGWQIYLAAPPIPKAVVTTDGEVLFTGDQIQYGQQAWMSAGGQQLGTVWGHGSYVAPDWSADWLERTGNSAGRVDGGRHQCRGRARRARRTPAQHLRRNRWRDHGQPRPGQGHTGGCGAFRESLR